jgi:murein DD-endopeptidase MepM/ murein hydrolase activator NlpD
MAPRPLLRPRARTIRNGPAGGAALSRTALGRTRGRRAALAVLLAFTGVAITPLPSRPAQDGFTDARRLAGLVDLSDSLASRWPVARAFVFPVGDRENYALPARSGAKCYTLLRGLTERTKTTSAHLGVDLGNRTGGDTVRAAGAGIVVSGRAHDWEQGYGWYVTVAHRLNDGSIVYTVYAHLRKGSVRVAPGDCVAAGDPVGRVGRSGRASTNHLHFELRRPNDPTLRWEKASAEDPLAFVREHLERVTASSE